MSITPSCGYFSMKTWCVHILHKWLREADCIIKSCAKSWWVSSAGEMGSREHGPGLANLKQVMILRLEVTSWLGDRDESASIYILGQNSQYI